MEVVIGTTKYRNYNQAVRKLISTGTKTTPAKTFGYTGEWLVTSSSVYPNGRKWVVRTTYQNAPEWDNDYIRSYES